MSKFPTKTKKDCGHVDHIKDIYNPETEMDKRATMFAMELLMPTKSFKFKWQEFDGDIKKISSTFQVEEAVCIMRAIELGLLGSFIKKGTDKVRTLKTTTLKNYETEC